MKKKLFTNSILILSMAVLSACPSNRSATAAADPNQGLSAPPVTPPSIPDSNSNISTSIMKTIQCEFEAQRYKEGFWDIPINQSVPKTISYISVDSRYQGEINLKNKFPIHDFGHFGAITLKFVPAQSTNSKNDTMVLTSSGLNKKLKISQSGFAGGEVTVQAEGQYINEKNRTEAVMLSISCRGTSVFSSTAQPKTSLACDGEVDKPTRRAEKVRFFQDLSTLVSNQTFNLASGLDARYDSAKNSLTLFSDLDPSLLPSITTSASLKSSMTFKFNDTRIVCKTQ